MENLLVIDILFSSMQVSEIREIVTYGWGNFLGMWDMTLTYVPMSFYVEVYGYVFVLLHPRQLPRVPHTHFLHTFILYDR